MNMECYKRFKKFSSIRVIHLDMTDPFLQLNCKGHYFVYRCK